MDIKLNVEFVALLITIITMGVGCFFSIKSALKEWRREHKEDMAKKDENLAEWRKEHKEDLAKMDAKIDKMDEKWERLFSLFVTQIKQQ
jgi:hypothetical protein